MTDTSSALATQSPTHLDPVTASSRASPAVNGSLSDNLPPEDDEPYTIKCICDFQDDDGNTVFCESCETWQHIKCYYNSKKVPEVHNCADCEPRPLDAKRATERQRRFREQTDGGDRKPKRPTAKAVKKKVKDVEHTNGWHTHDRQDSSSRDQPPAKRPKTGHRTSGSMSSVNGIPTLSTDGRKRALSSAQPYPSPTKSPPDLAFPKIPQYTSEFLHLYENDQGKSNLSMQNNFNTINVTPRLSAWLHDADALAQDTSNRQYNQVFIQSDAPLDPTAFPRVSLQTITKPEIDIEGKHPRWQILKLESSVKKDALVGEIKGSIGLLRDYSLDAANRWHELRHPEPFVFFHPQLPIYIDCRQEGTKFRYLRRSCRPNVTLKTYIDSEDEYHYCFVAKDDIPAGAELTTTWYLDQNVLSRDQIKEEHPQEGEYDLPQPGEWASRVLANFGDCACDSSQQPCMLAPLDRRRQAGLTETSGNKHANGRPKKTKTKQKSPPLKLSVSRASSENIKTFDEDEPFESNSTSGSGRSKPQSRDMTPTNAVDSTTLPTLTDREKRKIAAAEKTFERLEQDQHGQKKKKRASGTSTALGSGLNTTRPLAVSTQSQPVSPLVGTQPSYVDVGTSRPYSASPPLSSGDNHKIFAPIATLRKQSAPNTPTLPSPLRQSNYVDAAVQTDADSESTESPPARKRKFTTLTERLLKRCHGDRMRYEALEKHRRLSLAEAAPGSTVCVSPNEDQSTASLRRTPGQVEDVVMKDLDHAAVAIGSTSNPSLAAFKSSEGAEVSMFPPPPLPSQVAHTRKPLSPTNGYRLHLSTLPPIPTMPSATSATPPSVTPGSSQVASPFSLGSSNPYVGMNIASGGSTNSNSAIAPSPIKKKLSLGDYMSRRNATPAVEKTQAQVEAAVVARTDGDNQSQAGDADTSVVDSGASPAQVGKAEVHPVEAPTNTDTDIIMKDSSDASKKTIGDTTNELKSESDAPNGVASDMQIT